MMNEDHYAQTLAKYNKRSQQQLTKPAQAAPTFKIDYGMQFSGNPGPVKRTVKEPLGMTIQQNGIPWCNL